MVRKRVIGTRPDKAAEETEMTPTGTDDGVTPRIGHVVLGDHPPAVPVRAPGVECASHRDSTMVERAFQGGPRTQADLIYIGTQSLSDQALK
jgi:hypothetical protein